MPLPLLRLQSDTSALNMDPNTVLAGEPDKKFQPASPTVGPKVNAMLLFGSLQSTVDF